MAGILTRAFETDRPMPMELQRAFRRDLDALLYSVNAEPVPSGFPGAPPDPAGSLLFFDYEFPAGAPGRLELHFLKSSGASWNAPEAAADLDWHRKLYAFPDVPPCFPIPLLCRTAPFPVKRWFFFAGTDADAAAAAG